MDQLNFSVSFQPSKKCFENQPEVDGTKQSESDQANETHDEHTKSTAVAPNVNHDKPLRVACSIGSHQISFPQRDISPRVNARNQIPKDNVY